MGDQIVAVVSEEGHRRGTPLYRRTLLALWAAGIATFAALYWPQPVLPLIGRSFQVSAADAALTISAATIGLGATALCWSWLADRIGNDTAMKIALVASAVLGIIVPFSPSFPLLLVGRILQGIALGGVPALALTYLDKEIDARHVAIAAGGYVSGTAIGGLIGRLLAAPLAELIGWHLGALAVGVLAASCVVVLFFLLPRARPPLRQTGSSSVRTWQIIATHLRNPAMLALYAQAFLLMGAYVAMYNYLTYRLEASPFNLPISVTAFVFIVSLVGMFSSGIAGRIAVAQGRHTVLLCSAAVMAAGVVLTLPNWLPSILIGLTLFTAAFFAAHAIASGWVGPLATIGTAQATALYTLFYYAGSSVFGWLTGIAFTHGWIAVVIMLTAMTLLALLSAWVLLPRERAMSSRRSA